MKKNLLNSVQVSAPGKNRFDLTHDVKLSMNMGELVPVLCMDVVPGDRVNLGFESLIRLAPTVAPMMHRCDVFIHSFFVPNRLVWENFETWITNGGDEPTQVDPLPAFPYIRYNGNGSDGAYTYTRLMDYLGLPDPAQGVAGTSTTEHVSAIPFAAYQLIYNEYYRDQNLSEKAISDLIDGNNTAAPDPLDLVTIRKRAWEHDYLTSALPFAQKGQPVSIPIGGFDDVEVFRAGIAPPANTALTGAPSNINVAGVPSATFPTLDGLYAETSALDLQSTTINDLRRAYKLQEWLEKNARGGTRYSELIRVHFNETPEDARLQRPEYIVGIKTPIQISEVLNTTGTTELPQGNMAGHGVAHVMSKNDKYFVREHGYIIAIMSVLPKTAYFQGIPKHFLKITDPTEWYWPSFAHIGEQPILNKEVMAFNPAAGTDTFGYTPRYCEYKFMNSRVCGEFRTTLDFWHMARKFATAPALNEDFIQADPTHRVFAVTDEDEDKLYCQVLNRISAVRPMPVFGTPTF